MNNGIGEMQGGRNSCQTAGGRFSPLSEKQTM